MQKTTPARDRIRTSVMRGILYQSETRASVNSNRQPSAFECHAKPSQQSAKKQPNRRGSNSPPSTLTLIDGIHPQMLQKYCFCICTTGIRRHLSQKSANGNANGPVSNWPATKNTAADSHRPNSGGSWSKHHRGFAQRFITEHQGRIKPAPQGTTKKCGVIGMSEKAAS